VGGLLKDVKGKENKNSMLLHKFFNHQKLLIFSE